MNSPMEPLPVQHDRLWPELTWQVRELWAQRQHILFKLMLFMLLLILWPLAGKQAIEMEAVGVPIMAWVAMMLSIQWHIGGWFDDAVRYGTLEQWLIRRRELFGYVMLRLVMQWVSGPALLLVMLWGVSLLWPALQAPAMLPAMVAASVALSAWSALAAALTLGASQRTMLTFLLIWPWSLPCFIVGIPLSLTGSVLTGAEVGDGLLLLWGMAALSVPVALWGCATQLSAMLRQ